MWPTTTILERAEGTFPLSEKVLLDRAAVLLHSVLGVAGSWVWGVAWAGLIFPNYTGG